MNKKEQIEIINNLIKRLEDIRDNSEIDEILLEPYHIVEEAKFMDGTIIGTASQNITIRYNKMFMKKSEYDKWEEVK